MDKKQLIATVKQICDEKNIALESVIETIESALGAAYRKDFGNKLQNIKVEFNLETGDSKVFDEKLVVEDLPQEELDENGNPIVIEEEDEFQDNRDFIKKELQEDEKPKFNPKTQIQIKDAKQNNEKYQIGDIIKTELDVPADYGRMAAQTAKQVIIQKLREAERQVQYSDFKDREGEMIMGVVQRKEGNRIFVDLGEVTALFPIEEQVKGERYALGQRIRVLILSVSQTTKGPSIIVSRASNDFLRRLFEMEIPEVLSGVVQIKSVAREPGSRSKVAVFTQDENIDPIGSCVGQRGARIQIIIQELGGEKVDIIEWNSNINQFIGQAISPAKTENIEINEKERSAIIYVSADQLSLAIGKAGQNVRLAVKLTGWNLNIREVGKNKNIPIEENTDLLSVPLGQGEEKKDDSSNVN